MTWSGVLSDLRTLEDFDGGGAFCLLSEELRPDGSLEVQFSVACAHYACTDDGLPLRQRERFIIRVPPGFPFELPQVYSSHRRWTGFSHVQTFSSMPGRSYLCLYLAPDVEWQPQGGILGFLDRLDSWLAAGACNDWEPIGAPLHPPAVSAGLFSKTVIVRADPPAKPGERWYGYARVRPFSDSRLDVIEWSPLGTVPSEEWEIVAPSVILDRPFPFEYPEKVSELYLQLIKAGCPPEIVLGLLRLALVANGPGVPLFIGLGTPMRGVRGGEPVPALNFWRLSEEEAATVLESLSPQDGGDEEGHLDEEAIRVAVELWSKDVNWCSVLEERPSVVVRRDYSSPLSQFRGKAVSLWGCGAIGGHAAIMLARAGVRRLILHDRGVVTPGLLVRQPYTDMDVGRSKTSALEDHLRDIRPDLELASFSRDLMRGPLNEREWWDDTDLVIDASANLQVLQKLEAVLASGGERVPIVSMMMDAEAAHGCVTMSSAKYSGGPYDLLRKAKIRLHRMAPGGRFVEAFWPSEPGALFLPDPGCSSPTFVGSAADSAGITAGLLNLAADALAKCRDDSGSVAVIASPRLSGPAEPSTTVFEMPPDAILRDDRLGFQVRFTVGAVKSLMAWVRQSKRVRSPLCETGGVLFGERNDACQVMWVDDVAGPPLDSQFSTTEFVCGTRGVADMSQMKRTESGDSVRFVGMWHTHPVSAAIPSAKDLEGMARVVDASRPSPRKALLIILGRSASESPEMGAFMFECDRQ
jgi:proteasome lid subunit RPN8/RPN11